MGSHARSAPDPVFLSPQIVQHFAVGYLSLANGDIPGSLLEGVGDGSQPSVLEGEYFVFLFFGGVSLNRGSSTHREILNIVDLSRVPYS